MLRRTRNKMVGGVCGGIAKHIGVDASVIRIIVAFLSMFFYAPLFIYVMAWLIIPEE